MEKACKRLFLYNCVLYSTSYKREDLPSAPSFHRFINHGFIYTYSSLIRPVCMHSSLSLALYMYSSSSRIAVLILRAIPNWRPLSRIQRNRYKSISKWTERSSKGFTKWWKPRHSKQERLEAKARGRFLFQRFNFLQDMSVEKAPSKTLCTQMGSCLTP